MPLLPPIEASSGDEEPAGAPQAPASSSSSRPPAAPAVVENTVKRQGPGPIQDKALNEGQVRTMLSRVVRTRCGCCIARKKAGGKLQSCFHPFSESADLLNEVWRIRMGLQRVFKRDADEKARRSSYKIFDGCVVGR